MISTYFNVRFIRLFAILFFAILLVLPADYRGAYTNRWNS